MTGYESKRAAAQDKLAQPEQEPVAWMMPDGQIIDKWALQFYGGQAGKPLYTTPPQRTEERNFCPRCGKRTADLTTIHTCTPPQKENICGC